jgi:dTDP-glucose 4,6-dehydratase
MRFKRILVTGGAGFIGSAFIRFGLRNFSSLEKIVNVDLLTYAGCKSNCQEVAHDPRYLFMQGDIRHEAFVQTLIEQHAIDAIVHCAAETHVDTSISDPKIFLETNILGTFSLLEVVRRLPHVHFHHVSTDEVYGSLEEGVFSEHSNYSPNSPYAATKAASDHLVRAWAKTFSLSTTLSHCSNNFGPHQFPEKLIPRMILNCLSRKPLPIYGTGINVRDWLYVEDHAEALWTILEKGTPGETYNIGGENEKRNIDLLHNIIHHLGQFPEHDPDHLKSLITFVPDRPGHDLRYAVDCTKIKDQLGWTQRHPFPEALQKTIAWYVLQCEA